MKPSVNRFNSLNLNERIDFIKILKRSRSKSKNKKVKKLQKSEWNDRYNDQVINDEVIKKDKSK